MQRHLWLPLQYLQAGAPSRAIDQGVQVREDLQRAIPFALTRLRCGQAVALYLLRQIPRLAYEVLQIHELQ